MTSVRIFSHFLGCIKKPVSLSTFLPAPFSCPSETLFPLTLLYTGGSFFVIQSSVAHSLKVQLPLENLFSGKVIFP